MCIFWSCILYYSVLLLYFLEWYDLELSGFSWFSPLTNLQAVFQFHVASNNKMSDWHCAISYSLIFMMQCYPGEVGKGEICSPFPIFSPSYDSNPTGQDRYKQGSWSMGNYRWESLFQRGIQPLGSDHNHLLSLWMRLAITTINTSNSILAGASRQLCVGLCLFFHGG